MPDSFDYTTGTNSENVRLLQALIDDAPEYTEETNSRNANILKSIINNTEYTDAPQSEIEELLLRLKAKIGGEIEVDELNVTENGTYDAGVNKAYNPVKVELPLDSKTITENGTYTASDDNLAGFNEVTVAVEGYAKKSIANTPTAIATFNASALPMPSLTVDIEAVQDLHGYDRPWVGGAGKNKLEVTGKSSTDHGITFNVNQDGTIAVSGTYEDTQTNFLLTSSCYLKAGNYLINGVPSEPSWSTFHMYIAANGNKYASVTGTQFTIDEDGEYPVYISIYGEVSGTLIFKPMIRLATETDPTFEPYSNICPFSGWSAVNVVDTGVNVWDEEWESGLIDHTTGNKTTGNGICSKNYISVKADTNYYAHIPIWYRIAFFDANKIFISGVQLSTNIFTTPTNAKYMKLSTNALYGTTYNNDISINYQSTDTEYHTYNGTTYTTALKDGQGNSMTCYGGQLVNDNGVQRLTNETKIVVLDGSENWATDVVGDNKRRFTCILPIDLGVTTTTTFDAISNIYVNTKSAYYIDLSEVFILRYLSQYHQNRIDIMTEAYQDVASFKAFLNSTNMQIVYELATPQQIPQDSLSIATQEGTNNIWADSGDVQSGEYMEAL